uniref:AAC(3)-IV family aminoglycoside N-acetyltransferase n=1 Tax=Geminicoccus flavidas TaxID=2506407 RepID=UPI00135CCBEF
MNHGQLVRQLRDLGVVAGGVLLVHTAFRAIRPVEGGPDGLIDALLAAIGPDGTLVMPSWSGDDEQPFDPARSPAAADLGVVADRFWRRPGVRRSAHAHAFAAYGKLAERVTADPLPLPPHIPQSPVGRVYELDGQVLLLGVGHDADTMLHLAELIASVPYRTPARLTVIENGRPVRLRYAENNHCCERFAQADDWLRAAGLQREGPVGHGHGRLARARDIVRLATAHLAADPLLFLHQQGAGCAECDLAR